MDLLSVTVVTSHELAHKHVLLARFIAHWSTPLLHFFSYERHYHHYYCCYYCHCI